MRRALLTGLAGGLLAVGVYGLMGQSTPIGQSTELAPYPQGQADAPFCIGRGKASDAGCLLYVSQDGGNSLPSGGIGTVCPIDLNFASISNQSITASGSYTLGSYTTTVVNATGVSAVYIDAGSLVVINSGSVTGTQPTNCGAVIPSTDWYMSIPLGDANFHNWYLSRVEVAGSCGTGTNGSGISVDLMNRDANSFMANLIGTGIHAEVPGTSILIGQCAAGTGSASSRSSGFGTAKAGMVISKGGLTANMVQSFENDSYSGSFSQSYWATASPSAVLNTSTNITWSASNKINDNGWSLYVIPWSDSFNNAAVCAIQRVRVCYSPTWSQ